MLWMPVEETHSRFHRINSIQIFIQFQLVIAPESATDPSGIFEHEVQQSTRTTQVLLIGSLTPEQAIKNGFW